MTASAFLGITSAVQAALQAGPALHAGLGSVVRGRRTVAPAGHKWQVAINGVRHDGEPLDLSGLHLRWQSLVTVVASVRAASDEDAEAALDPLLQTVWQRLKTMNQPAGLLATTLDPQIALDFDEADQTVATATFVLRVHHVSTAVGLLAPA